MTYSRRKATAAQESLVHIIREKTDMQPFTCLLLTLLDNGVLIKAAIKFRDNVAESDREDWSILFCEPEHQAWLRQMVYDYIGLDCPIVDCCELFDAVQVAVPLSTTNTIK